MRPLLLAGPAIAVAITALALLEWPARQYLDTDFLAFYAGGRALLEGWDPYDPGPFLDFYRAMGSQGQEFAYPDLAYRQPLWTAVASLPFAVLPFALASAAWLTTQALTAALALAALGRRLFGEHLRRDLVALLGIAAASQPSWLVPASGNVGGFLLAIVAGGLALLAAGRPFLAGALFGLLIVKPHPFLWFGPGVLLATSRGRGRLVGGVAATAAPLVALSFVARPAWVPEWLGAVAYVQGLNQSRANAFGLAPASDRWLGLFFVAAVVAVLVWWWMRHRPSRLALLAGLLPLSLFAAPYVWSYDFGVLLVTTAVSLALVRDEMAAARAVWLALLAVVAVLLPWLLYATAFVVGDERFGGLVPLLQLATLLFLDARGREVRRLALAAAPPPGSS